MTCAEWKAAKESLDQWIASGQWLKKRILIEGDEVEFTSFSQVERMLAYIDNKKSVLPRSDVGNSVANLDLAHAAKIR